MSRGKWILLIIVAVLVLALIGVMVAATVFVTSDRLESWAEQQASSALGRDVVIDGGLAVDWSLSPRLRARDVRVANTTWADAESLASAALVAGRIDLPALLRGTTHLSDLRVKNPRLYLQRAADGRRNWVMGSESSDSGELPLVDALHVTGGEIRYLGPQRQKPLRVALESLDASLSGAARRLQLEASGQHRGGQPFQLSAMFELGGGAPRALRGSLTYGEHHASIKGQTGASELVADLQAQVSLRGPALGELLPDDASTAELPAYEASFALGRDGEAWVVESLDAELGKSDVAGTIRYANAQRRIALTADLTSQQVDLTQFLGTTGGGGSVRVPTAMLDLLDAELAWRVQTLNTNALALEQVALDTTLKGGKLAIKPLRFTLAGGQGAVDLTLRSRSKPPRSMLKVSFEAIDLSKALARFDVDREGFGKLNIELSTRAAGETLDDMVASADGDVAAIMQGGRIDQALVQKAKANLGSLLASLSEENETVPLRCTIADASLDNGLVSFQRLLVDTDSARIVGDGEIDLKDYALDLLFVPRNKDFSLISGEPPIHLQGTLLQPELSVDTSATLGSLATPIELGVAEDANCSALAEAARKGLTFKD